MAESSAPDAVPMDWQFAYERSEMLRSFQAGLLISIGHELRNPLSSQIGSLQMILCDLCNSPEEEREYLETSKRSVEQLVHLLEEYSHLVRYPLPVQPLHPHPIDLLPLLRDVHQLTRLQAQDQGLRYLWPDLQDASPPLLIQADPIGWVQALLGLCWWGIQHLRYGTLQIGGLRAEQEQHPQAEILQFPLRFTGALTPSADPRDHPHWRVCQRLLQNMQGDLHLMECRSDRVEVEIGIRSGSHGVL